MASFCLKKMLGHLSLINIICSSKPAVGKSKKSKRNETPSRSERGRDELDGTRERD